MANVTWAMHKLVIDRANFSQHRRLGKLLVDKLENESAEKTAFTTHCGFSHFTRMLLGYVLLCL